MGFCAVWYICAMMRKSLAVCAVLLAIVWGPAATAGQTTPTGQATTSGQATRPPAANPPLPSSPNSVPANSPAAAPPITPVLPPAASGANPANPASGSDCVGGNCDLQPSHIAISTPAPAAAPWPWQERIAWGANIVLAILGYAGIMLALSTLRKIERQTQYAEDAAQAAASSAQAALLHAQAIVRAERPWLLVTAEPSPNNAQNSFTILATNRGRSPARLESCLHHVISAAGEAYLPKAPDFKLAKQSAPAESAILLPGEFITITGFNRDEVKDFCQTDERLKQIEDWTGKIYLYGRLTYRDLNAPPEEQFHATDWCCWYIHGRQKSGMVIGGPPAYNQHT
jgi:hypothetical protein